MWHVLNAQVLRALQRAETPQHAKLLSRGCSPTTFLLLLNHEPLGHSTKPWIPAALMGCSKQT